MIERAPNWRLRLLQWTSEINGHPFEWGETDCGSLVRKACERMYEQEVFPGVINYTTLRGAKRAWNATGGTAQKLKDIGAEKIDINFSQRGDIIITEEDEFDFYAAMIDVGQAGYLACAEDYGVVLLKAKDLPEDVYALRLPDEIDIE